MILAIPSSSKEEMACYIFDCPALPEGTAGFTVEGNALRILP